MWNKDSVDNQKILKDLAELSEMRIVRDPETFKLPEITNLIEPPQRNTKKNKKNHSRKG